MKNPLLLAWLFLISLLSACSDKEVAPSITLSDTSQMTIAFDSEENSDPVEVTFSSTKPWTAVSTAAWMTVSPRSGEAGDKCTITITPTMENTTGSLRTGYVTLASEGTKFYDITVTQDVPVVYFAEFAQSQYVVEAEGADELQINLTSNVPVDQLGVAKDRSGTWIHFANEDTESRAVTQKLGFTVRVDANTERTPRSASMYLLRYASEDSDEYEILGSVEVMQMGQGSSTSTDYSADGQVRTIQTHSVGAGIPIVLMGDGFIDEDIASGWYDQAIDKAVENFFTEEPIKSMRDYFDIYSVTVVSPNNVFSDGFETALKCEFEGGGSTGISGDDETVLEYAYKVEGLDVFRSQIIVVLNTTTYAGTTYYGYQNSETKKILELAIAYCPIVDGIDEEAYRQVMVHESVGHGFAKLEDEYGYDSQGEISESDKKTILKLQGYGWAQNVDFTSDPSTVLWHAFLEDSRFSGQGLGVYEGGATYVKGVYRPTEESMMRSNIEGFNAPSRQAIYNRIIREGLETEPTYEDFAQYDIAHPYRTDTKATKPSARLYKRDLPHPRFVNKAIRVRK
jgi:hypothetical protein